MGYERRKAPPGIQKRLEQIAGEGPRIPVAPYTAFDPFMDHVAPARPAGKAGVLFYPRVNGIADQVSDLPPGSCITALGAPDQCDADHIPDSLIGRVLRGQERIELVPVPAQDTLSRLPVCDALCRSSPARSVPLALLFPVQRAGKPVPINSASLRSNMPQKKTVCLRSVFSYPGTAKSIGLHRYQEFVDERNGGGKVHGRWLWCLPIH